MNAHQIAEIFPLIADAPMVELVEDIRLNGLLEPIILYEGKILDGRNRYAACLAAGVEPVYRDYEGNDPLQFVISRNLHRRHLTESQRAMIAARLANMPAHRPSISSSIGLLKTQSEAAILMNVSVQSIKRARNVINSGDQDIEMAVDRGEISVSRAANLVRGSQYLSAYEKDNASCEWYTPGEFVEAARKVMGVIDLDPASCEVANQTVKAERFFTRDDDGLSKTWYGKVFMNPPYGDMSAKFVSKLLDEYQSGNVTSAIAVLNSFSVTNNYFEPLWDHLICFARGRVKFYQANTDKRQAPINGTVFVYLGLDEDNFVRVFSNIGYVVKRIGRAA